MPTLATRVTRLARVFGLIRSATGGVLVAWAGALLLQGLLPVLIVYLTKPLVDGVQVAVGRGFSWESVRPFLAAALAMGAALVLGELLKAATQWISAAQSELVQDHVGDLLHAKAASLDMAFFESPDFYDRLYRVRFDASTRSLALLESTGGLVQNAVTAAGVAALLLSYGWWLALALVAATIPAFLVVLLTTRRYHAWWMATTTDRRRAQYFGDLLTGGMYAAELRLFGLAQLFRARFLELRQRLRTERLALLRSQALLRLGAEGAALLVSAGTIGWMVWRALLGLATLGDIALFYQAFQRGQGLMRTLVGNLSQIYSNSLFLENLFEYFDMTPTVVGPPDAVAVPGAAAHGVRFTGVAFRYPGTDRLALDGFTLAVEPGQTVAIVGANGAGKSTLVKLICRFYDPEEGRVELNGIDLRRFDPQDLRRSITVMFQAPVQYQGTVRENISLSALNQPTDLERLDVAAREAGVHELAARLPRGYDSVLGRMFPEGTELSGGEWQRIAMARAVYRRSGLIVLDEPTSMMDSWTEAAWYARFRHVARDSTAIIITHRLTIARRADVIHVMERGRITESGTHDELVALGGRYARSWDAQVRSSVQGASLRAVTDAGH